MRDIDREMVGPARRQADFRLWADGGSAPQPGMLTVATVIAPKKDADIFMTHLEPAKRQSTYLTWC